MVFPLTDIQKRAFLGTHEMTFTATCIRGTESLGEFPVISAEVSATYGTQGGRDAVLVVPRQVIDAGLLNPLSDQVLIRTGIRDMVEIPLFTGRVDETSESDNGLVRVQLLSRGGEAIRAAFETPWAAGPAGTKASAEMQRILQSIDPSWGVDTSDASAAVIPAGLVWEIDPGQALDQLAQGASLIWQPDRSGGFRIYTNPYSFDPMSVTESVVTLRDGVAGTTVTIEKNESRASVYNSVTVVTERVDNTPPVRVTVRDSTPGSPTVWAGLFGKQNLVIKNQTPLTQQQSLELAGRVLRQSLSLRRSFRISTPNLPFLDPGDVFVLWYQDVVFVMVVETIGYSTEATQATVISARELVLNITMDIE